MIYNFTSIGKKWKSAVVEFIAFVEFIYFIHVLTSQRVCINICGIRRVR